MKTKPEPITPPEEGLHVVTSEASVSARLTVGNEIRITSRVMDGTQLIAEFAGATAPARAEECLKLAKDQKARGVPIIATAKCRADGARVIRGKDVGPMLPWGGIPSRA